MWSRLKKPFAFASRRPMTVFFVLLAVLLGLIYTNQQLHKEALTDKAETAQPAKSSPVFRIGTDRTDASLSGEIKKSGLIRVVALAGGTVSRIAAEDGARVWAGQPIVILADTYAGRSLSDIDRLTAEEKLRIQDENRSLSRELLELERKIAVAATASDREEDAAKASERVGARTLKSDLALAQLEAERARLAAALSRPASNLAGTVEHVFVRPGDYVAPGTLIATVRAAKTATLIEASLPLSQALLVDTERPAAVRFDGQALEARIVSVSREAVEDGLAVARFSVDGVAALPDGQFVSLSVPLRPSTDTILVPLAALRETADRTFVLVEKDSLAESRAVALGTVSGDAVVVTDGLAAGDAVILDRSVIEGDRVTISQ